MNQAYSQKDIRRAVNLSALLGWAVIAVPFSFTTGEGGVLEDPVEVMIWAAILGLPVAFGTLWLIGAPILRRVMRNPLTWFGAARWGAVTAFAIAAVFVAIDRFLGWLVWLDPSTSSQIGGGDKIRSIDGILTPYGWQVVAQNTLIFMALGVVVALVVRFFIGGGRQG